MSAEEAVAALRSLVAIDGAFFPCIQPCGDEVCELASRVLGIVEQVR